MPSRRKAREFALQMLFQEDIAEMGADDVCALFWQGRRTDPETREFSERLFFETLRNREKADDIIRKHARNWKLDRMPVVDRNILRLAVCEFLAAETPPVVVIDEAIEVARKFSTPDSAEFVNGVLDSIRKDLEGKPVSE